MTPLLLVAGFLGAGKTTFLRALVPALARRGLRPRVLLNDFDDARIDAATLRDLVPDVAAVSGSCLCCDTLEGLLDGLRQLPAEPGQVAVVETNGTTDTALLLTLVSGSAGLGHLALPLQLTVVDAVRFGQRDWQNVMEREQIATATHLVVSRTDLVSAERSAQVQAELRRIAPLARHTSAEALAGLLAQVETEVRPRASAAAPPAERPASHATHHFASLVVDLPGPVDSAAFLRFLRELPPEVLRAKGIVALRDLGGEKRSFQKVDSEVEISPCRLADPDELETAAILVGPSIPALTVRARVRRLYQ